MIVWFTRGRSIIGVSVPTGDVPPLLPHKSASCHGGVAFTVLPGGFAGLVPGTVKDGRQMGCVPSPPPPCLRYKGPFKTAVWAPLHPRPRQSLRKKKPGAEIENRGGAIGKKKPAITQGDLVFNVALALARAQGGEAPSFIVGFYS